MPLRDDALNRTSAYRAPLVWRVPEGPGISVGQRSNTRNHAGPDCGAGGRWQGLEGYRDEAPNVSEHQVPLVWRVPEGRDCGAGGRGQGQAGRGHRPPAHKAARPHGKVRRCPEHQQRRKQRCGRATARRHAKQPGPTARCDGARSTRGTTHHRRQSARIPSQQRRQVDAPAARELGCLGAAREAVRQIHRVRLSIKRGQQRMRCDRD